MSGGHFNGHGYIYYQVSQFADELENDIENNNRENEYGYFPGYREEVLEFLREQVKAIRKMSQIMKDIDYLYSGDHGEDSFLKRVKKVAENE